MNKLFNQWKSDFDSFWDKLPKTGRIFVGVLISFGIALMSLNLWIVPQRKQLEGLGKKAPRRTERIPSPEKDLDIMEARVNAKRLAADLKKWKQQVSEYKSGATYLKPEYCAEVLLAIDELAANSGLSIRSRIDSTTLEKLKKPSETRGRGVKKSIKTTGEKNSVGHFIYRYEMIGDFKNTYAFLYRLKKINGLFEVNNIKIKRFGKEDRKFKKTRLGKTSGLIIRFDVTVYYL